MQNAATFFTEVVFQQLSPLHNFVAAFCTRWSGAL